MTIQRPTRFTHNRSWLIRERSALVRRLLRIPLFYKILLVNSAIVALGAIAGTIITVWHVRSFPGDLHYELIMFFAIAGLAISFAVNYLALRLALAPLDQIQSAVRRGAARPDGCAAPCRCAQRRTL